MEEVLVSVLCLSYNHKQYIEKALDSILMQKTNFKFEILIHDDASTDGTTKIIQKYEKKYPDIVKPVYQKSNQYSKGVKINQTYNYPRAKGKYIAYCECDDFWLDELKLQKEVEILEKNQEYVAVSHWCNIVDQYGKENSQIPQDYWNVKSEIISFTDWNLDWRNGINIVGQMATILHRNIPFVKMAQKIQGEVQINGDILLTICLLHYGKVYCIHEIMSSYRYVNLSTADNWNSKIAGKNLNYYYWLVADTIEKNLNREYGSNVNLSSLKNYYFCMAFRKMLFCKSKLDKKIFKQIRLNYINPIKVVYLYAIAVVRMPYDIIKAIKGKKYGYRCW